LVAAFVVACLLLAGVLMVPLLQHYAAAGLLLTAMLLYVLFVAGARSGNPLVSILVIALTFIPVAGVAEQDLVTTLSKAFGAGLAIGVLVGNFGQALFPDAPRPAVVVAAPALPSAETARWIGLQGAVVVLPVLVLALANPTLYLAAIMKTVTVAQQAGSTNARSAGRELVGSTVVGAALAIVIWVGLSVRANLWMLALWITAAAFWAGTRLFRIKVTAAPPSYWLNVLLTMLILLGPAIEDSQNGKDVYAASATRITLFILVALYAWATVWVLERWRTARS